MNEHRIGASDTLFFRGREGDPRLGEWVLRDDAPVAKGAHEIVLFGCPDDTGVRLNRGRAGAAEGPDSIRKHLYKMTLPMEGPWEMAIALRDWGNVVPEGEDIVETHRRVCETAARAAGGGATVILLGGGHDFAAPGFLGFLEGRKQKASLINVDPHLDLRPLENERPHSGTPFRVILESGMLKGKRFTEFGARAGRNARTHYEYAREKGVRVLTLEELKSDKKPIPALYTRELARLTRPRETVGCTFDMDACESAEGVSAAPVIGFSAWEMVAMAAAAGAEKKVAYFEIAEVAPPLDSHERSSRIAAEMIFAFLRARAKVPQRTNLSKKR